MRAPALHCSRQEARGAQCSRQLRWRSPPSGLPRFGTAPSRGPGLRLGDSPQLPRLLTAACAWSARLGKGPGSLPDLEALASLSLCSRPQFPCLGRGSQRPGSPHPRLTGGLPPHPRSRPQEPSLTRGALLAPGHALTTPRLRSSARGAGAAQPPRAASASSSSSSGNSRSPTSGGPGPRAARRPIPLSGLRRRGGEGPRARPQPAPCDPLRSAPRPAPSAQLSGTTASRPPRGAGHANVS